MALVRPTQQMADLILQDIVVSGDELDPTPARSLLHEPIEPANSYVHKRWPSPGVVSSGAATPATVTPVHPGFGSETRQAGSASVGTEN